MQITTKDAVLDPSGTYRYELSRSLSGTMMALNPLPGQEKTILWIMLNPSTADASIDDPTIRKCMGFSSRWGYRTLLVGNLFAWRATDPKQLKKLSREEAVGPENDMYLRSMIQRSDMVVCAWGNHGVLHGRNREIRPLVDEVYRETDQVSWPVLCLGTTKNGQPKHPLYVPYEASLIDFL